MLADAPLSGYARRHVRGEVGVLTETTFGIPRNPERRTPHSGSGTGWCHTGRDCAECVDLPTTSPQVLFDDATTESFANPVYHQVCSGQQTEDPRDQPAIIDAVERSASIATLSANT